MHRLSRALTNVIQPTADMDTPERSEARFRAMSDESPMGIIVADAQGHGVYSNAAYQKISGLTHAQTLGSRWLDGVHPEDRQCVVDTWHIADRDSMPFQCEVRLSRKDGSIVWVRMNTSVMHFAGKSQEHLVVVEDITARKLTEAALQESDQALFEEKERAQVTLNSIGDAVLATDRPGRVTYMNPVAETMTGWARADALGRPLAEVFSIIDGTTRQAAANPAQRAMDEDCTVALAADCVLVRRDGFEFPIEDSAAPIHARDGQVAGAVIVFHDVSQARSMAQKMSHLAQHDFLTDLPNRALLTERLSQAIGLAQRHRKQIALLYLDLDYFKRINDSLGHVIGDQLLQSVAQRLVSCVRTTDTVCRQGGDEFVILLTKVEHSRDAAHVAEKLRSAFALPHLVGGRELHITLSIGIGVYPDDGLDVDTVIQSADTAMYQVKANGRNNYQFFKSDMNTRAVHRLFIESNLRRALRQQEFVLHYQPKIDLVSGRMTGTEALIRWLDPDLGLVYPAQFVPIAEECGLIVPIGQWALREACRQVQDWLDHDLSAVPVAVNISAIEFRHKGFVQGVALILEETGLAPEYLTLELTESILMHDVEPSASVLASLKAMGIQLAIDDFGTGYSSLSYLRKFPIDTLKIDQSLVRDIATDSNGATIVSAVIGMGRNLKQRVVAEGVETIEQLSFLRAQNCDEGQGYQFSHPLTSTEFELLLRTEGGPQLTTRPLREARA